MAKSQANSLKYPLLTPIPEGREVLIFQVRGSSLMRFLGVVHGFSRHRGNALQLFIPSPRAATDGRRKVPARHPLSTRLSSAPLALSASWCAQFRDFHPSILSN